MLSVVLPKVCVEELGWICANNASTSLVMAELRYAHTRNLVGGIQLETWCHNWSGDGSGRDDG